MLVNEKVLLNRPEKSQVDQIKENQQDANVMSNNGNSCNLLNLKDPRKIHFCKLN